MKQITDPTGNRNRIKEIERFVKLSKRGISHEIIYSFHILFQICQFTMNHPEIFSNIWRDIDWSFS